MLCCQGCGSHEHAAEARALKLPCWHFEQGACNEKANAHQHDVIWLIYKLSIDLDSRNQLGWDHLLEPFWLILKINQNRVVWDVLLFQSQPNLREKGQYVSQAAEQRETSSCG